MSSSHVLAHAHELIKRKRAQVREPRAALPRLKQALAKTEDDVARLGDDPAWFRKVADLRRHADLLRATVDDIESGRREKEVEDLVTSYWPTILQRCDTKAAAKARKAVVWDHMPQMLDRGRSAATSLAAEDAMASIGSNEANDPKVALDELALELSGVATKADGAEEGDDAKMYMNPHDICDDCDVPMKIVVSHPLLVCPVCQKNRPFLDVTQASMGFGRNLEFNRVGYVRHGHFKDILDKVQANRKFQVALETYEKVMFWLMEHGVEPEDVTIKTVYTAIHDLKLNDSYDSFAQIHSVLTNSPLEMFSKQQREKLHIMFRATQEPFERAEKDRKNYVAYNYCMHKLVELLGLEHWKVYFPLLKISKNKDNHDELWQKICKALDWEFVPSPCGD